MPNRKCMKGYTMNSNGSCVPIKRTNTKQRGLSNSTSRNQNRAELPCCSQGCYRTTWTAQCVDIWDSSVGLYRRELDLYVNPSHVGGAIGCKFSSHDNHLENAKNAELRYLARTGGGYCTGNFIMPQGSQMVNCNHTFDTCEYEGHKNSYCSGWWTLNEDGGVEWGHQYGNYNCDSNYMCGNAQPKYASEAPPKTEWRRGGKVRRRRRR